MRSSRKRAAAKTVTLSVALSSEDGQRVLAMAARSHVSVDRWLALAVMSAVGVDEAHWREMAERDVARAEIASDRNQFGHLSVFLRQMPDGCFSALVDRLVSEREKGRAEGSASALRLAAVRS